MKRILFATMIALGMLGFANVEANAQVNVNINIGRQPAWGPTGYNYVQYYYIPEYNIYYDVMTNRYVYLNNRSWVHAAALPPHLRHIDLYRTHKVVINQNNPFRYNDKHLRTYGKYRNYRSQVAIRDNRMHNDRTQHGMRNDRPHLRQQDRMGMRNERQRIAQNHQRDNDRMHQRDHDRGPRR